MRSAIVAGGQGFIGRRLVKVLRRNGADVRTLGGPQSVEPTHIVLRLFVDKIDPHQLLPKAPRFALSLMMAAP
jgi:nucleoside-diphosphate-sugar epimerase